MSFVHLLKGTTSGFYKDTAHTQIKKTVYHLVVLFIQLDCFGRLVLVTVLEISEVETSDFSSIIKLNGT